MGINHDLPKQGDFVKSERKDGRDKVHLCRVNYCPSINPIFLSPSRRSRWFKAGEREFMDGHEPATTSIGSIC